MVFEKGSGFELEGEVLGQKWRVGGKGLGRKGEGDGKDC